MNTEPDSTSLDVRLKQLERELNEAQNYSRNSMILCSIGALIFLYGVFAGSIPALLIGLLVMGVFIFPVMKWPQKIQELKEQITTTEEEFIQNRKRSMEHTHKCPYCAEAIMVDAILCRYCGRDLPQAKLQNRLEYLEESHSDTDIALLRRTVILEIVNLTILAKVHDGADKRC